LAFLPAPLLFWHFLIYSLKLISVFSIKTSTIKEFSELNPNFQKSAKSLKTSISISIQSIYKERIDASDGLNSSISEVKHSCTLKTSADGSIVGHLLNKRITHCLNKRIRFQKGSIIKTLTPSLTIILLQPQKRLDSYNFGATDFDYTPSSKHQKPASRLFATEKTSTAKLKLKRRGFRKATEQTE
jgi:hypothetical protein